MPTLTSRAPSSQCIAPGVPLWRELERRQPKLAAWGLLLVLAAIPLTIAGFVDPRTINGVGVWVKPVKFLVSTGVYLWTLGWFFGYLAPGAQRTRAGRYVIHATPALVVLEMAWIIGMAAAGEPSHFNRASPLAAALYGFAGLAALGLTASMLVQGVMLARDRAVSLPPAFRLSLVLGSVVGFVGTVAFAGFMASGQGHWVGGIASDAAGLPLMSWSRTGGDLRVAHFWATHAQQFVPLAGAILVRSRFGWTTRGVWIAALGYAAFVVFTFAQALGGRPFIAI